MDDDEKEGPQPLTEPSLLRQKKRNQDNNTDSVPNGMSSRHSSSLLWQELSAEKAAIGHEDCSLRMRR
jgi:hypothetical protein